MTKDKKPSAGKTVTKSVNPVKQYSVNPVKPGASSVRNSPTRPPAKPSKTEK